MTKGPQPAPPPSDKKEQNKTTTKHIILSRIMIDSFIRGSKFYCFMYLMCFEKHRCFGLSRDTKKLKEDCPSDPDPNPGIVEMKYKCKPVSPLQLRSDRRFSLCDQFIDVLVGVEV